METKYIKSGEAARMLNITTTTLANWERRGILIPDRKLNSGHRLYKLETINNMLRKSIISV